MNQLFIVLALFVLGPLAFAGEFKSIGDFLLQSHFKLTGQQMTPIPIKPVVFHVSTDGVQIRVATGDAEDSYATFEIYSSNGIGRPRPGANTLEILPGLQAMSRADGALRHLCISRESMTLTTFPCMSDQTVVSYAIVTQVQPKSPHSIDQTTVSP